MKNVTLNIARLLHEIDYNGVIQSHTEDGFPVARLDDVMVWLQERGVNIKIEYVVALNVFLYHIKVDSKGQELSEGVFESYIKALETAVEHSLKIYIEILA